MSNLVYTFESTEGDSESYTASSYDIAKEVIIGYTTVNSGGDNITLPVIQGYEKPYLYNWKELDELHAWYVETKGVTQ